MNKGKPHNTYAVNLSRMETNTTLITLLSLLALVAGASFVWVPLLTKVFLDMGGRRSDRAMRVGLVSLVFFIIYDAADLGFHQKVGCGLGAGLVGALVGNPADLAMVRMQADGRLPPAERRNYRNGGQALVHIARSEGITTLWRGCAPTINRAMIVTASQMAIYDQTKQEIKKRSGMEEGLGLHTASSLVAGFVAAITSNPFDVAKTRLMNMSADRATGQMPFKGTFDCMLKSVRSDGLGALYKGLNATIVRQVPLNMVRFTAMEQLKIMLKIA